jgi:alpha-galactosidase
MCAIPELIFYQSKSEFGIRFNSDVEMSGLSCAVKVNGDWIRAEAFPEKGWTIQYGEVNRLSVKEKGDGKVRIYELSCSGLPPVKEFRLLVERVEDRPWLAMEATVRASEDFDLGGFKILSGNVPIGTNRNEWTLFLEDLRAPNYGRIIRPSHLKANYKGKSGRRNRPNVAAWVSTLAADDRDEAFSFAALQGELWPTFFEWNRSESLDELHLTVRSSSRNQLEKVLVRSGKEVSADPVLVGFWDDKRPTKTLLKTGQIMGRNVRKGQPMNRPEPGWSTWHSNARNISSEKMLSAARFMKNNLYEAGFRYIQLDGGWWENPGTYEVNGDFSRGIRYVSNQIKDIDLKFGLHISPFRVSPSDPYWKNQSDWLLSPYGKDPVNPFNEERMEELSMIYLDGSHPEVGPYLMGKYSQMVMDFQPTFMKWDHHYGSLEEAPRYNPEMTGLQSHNRVIRMIRKSLPDNLIITRSMGWLLGAVECFDAIRIGNDINHPGIVSEEKPYANMTYGKTTGTIDSILKGKDYKGLIRFARSAAQNYYIHNNIAICDPDAFFTTPQYTLNEARCHITLQALMGGLLFAGDRLEGLPAERLAFYKHKPLLDIWKAGKHAIPLDLFSGADIPRVWKLELSDRTVFGIFNWIDEPSKTVWTMSDLEMKKQDYQLTDLWDGKPVEMKNGKLQLNQKPHSVRLIEFNKK